MTTKNAPVKAAAKAPAKAPAKKAAPKAAAPAATDMFAMPKFDLSKFEMPSFDMPAFDMSAFEMPENPLPDMMRDYAEKSIASAREGYVKAKASVEEGQAALEESVDTAIESTTALNKKVLDATQSNMAAGFDLVRDILGVKTLGDAIELQTAFIRKQFEVVSGQSKDIQDSISKSVEDVSAPVKKIVEKSMDNMKAA
jgi:phasin